MGKEWKGNVLGLFSIAIAALAFINEQSRLLVALIFSASIIFYIINSFSDDIDKVEERTKKLEERLSIYKELINIKSDIQALKKKGGIKDD